ncbi:hypothetical protein [Campylobacter sp. CCUG 57310]|nr:hypothetical protein [Campylobacter sp. CCUG 57310]
MSLEQELINFWFEVVAVFVILKFALFLIGKFQKISTEKSKGYIVLNLLK